MKAADVMVSNVITTTPDASVADVAELLLKHRISALPVVDAAGELIGIVSEGDLIRRSESGTERRRSWWLEVMTSKQTLASEFVKSHATKVADIMTRSVITASPTAELSDIAELLEKNGIKRVPIVQGKKVVGIVSRANLLQAIAMARRPAAMTSSDIELRTKVVEQLSEQPWASPSLINPIVHDGVVDLWGIVDSAAEKRAVRVAVEVVPGVRTVNDNLVVQPVTSGV